MLTVKNGNGFDFIGRFNGVDYQFPSGATVAITEDAASHIFGVGKPDRTEVILRNGWQNGTTMSDAIEKLNKFSFDVAFNLNAGDVIDVPQPTEQSPAPLLADGGAVVSDGITAPTDVTKTLRGSILDNIGGL